MTGPNFPHKNPRSAEEVRAKLALDWFATSARIGAGALEDKLGAVDRDTLGNALKGKHTPRLHTALNSLLADPAALTNTLLLFGVVAVPAEEEALDDDAVISGMLRAATDYFERMKDRKRCHNDTVALADLFAPLVPAMLAIVREAGKIRGGGE
jgi:hypothetical protein